MLKNEVEKSFTMELLEEMKRRSRRWKIAFFISLAMWGGTIVVFYAKTKCKLHDIFSSKVR